MIVVASGAFEQPAVFRNNDLPGVMLASARTASDLSLRVKPMDTAVVLAANREGYDAALDLLRRGVQVAAWWICGPAANRRLPAQRVAAGRSPRADGRIASMKAVASGECVSSGCAGVPA